VTDSRRRPPILARPPLIVAHRGFAAAHPENTLLAFRAALATGADALECDVRLSADGVPVVIHDATLDRTTDGTGPVARRSWRELARLDAGAWFSTAAGGETIPRLSDLLALVRTAGTTVRLFVEVKDGEGERPGITAAVVAAIRATGMCERAALGSFRTDVLAAAAALAPDVERHQIVGGPPATWPVTPVPVRAVNADARHCDAATLARLHGRGLAVHVWTVNEPDGVTRFAAWGAEGIITDDPAMARAALRSEA
jgi:glycerophosphoryl diester phosphodiesterase